MNNPILKGANTPTPMAHYCQGVLHRNTIYAAGQIASDYQTGVPSEAKQSPAFPYYGSDIQKQAKYVLQNIKSVFESAGSDFRDVVTAQVFLTDLNDFYLKSISGNKVECKQAAAKLDTSIFFPIRNGFKQITLFQSLGICVK